MTTSAAAGSVYNAPPRYACVYAICTTTVARCHFFAARLLLFCAFARTSACQHNAAVNAMPRAGCALGVLAGRYDRRAAGDCRAAPAAARQLFSTKHNLLVTGRLLCTLVTHHTILLFLLLLCRLLPRLRHTRTTSASLSVPSPLSSPTLLPHCA